MKKRIINLTNEKYHPVPTGEYVCEITKWIIKPSKFRELGGRPNQETLAISFTIGEGEYSGQSFDGLYELRSAGVSENRLSKIGRLLTSLLGSGQFKGANYDLDGLLGIQCLVNVELEINDNQKRTNSVARVLPLKD